MEIISKVRARYLVLYAIFFLTFLSLGSFAKSAPPTLDEVLKKPGPAFSWNNILFGFFALSLSTLSMAKAYELFKKTGNKSATSDNDIDKTEIENLKCKIDEFSSTMAYKNEEEQDLRDQVLLLEESLKEKLDSEELMKKSISSLRKECEKLVSEKEKLNLELSRKSWEELFNKNEEPVAEVVPVKKKSVTKAKTSLNKKRRK